MVEIAKALSTDARLIIMDESTSSLTSREIQELFAVVRKLRRQGRGIVCISHRLQELEHIVDHVTILRDEIQKTRRRINALEHVMIPQFEDTIRFISMKLDENERGSLTRLMKVEEMIRDRT